MYRGLPTQALWVSHEALLQTCGCNCAPIVPAQRRLGRHWEKGKTKAGVEDPWQPPSPGENVFSKRFFNLRCSGSGRLQGVWGEKPSTFMDVSFSVSFLFFRFLPSDTEQLILRSLSKYSSGIRAAARGRPHRFLRTWPLFGRTWPQGPSRLMGLVREHRLHTENAILCFSR